MAAKSDQLEITLDNIFEKNAPKLPANARKAIVEWAPWVALVVGILTLWGAWALWSWAHVANDLVNYANQLSVAYGGTPVMDTRMTLWVWIGMVTLVIEGALYILAFFGGLREHKKSGWNYLYWGALVNVAYAVISLFTGYGFGGFLGSMIGSVIGFWLLFQVRSLYTGGRA